MAELLTISHFGGAIAQAPGLEDMPTVVAPPAAWSAAPAILGQLAVQLLGAAFLRIGKAVDRFVAYVDRMAFQPHPASDPFRRPP